MHNLLKATRVIRISNAVAAGTSNINCGSVDLRGFEGVAFVALFGSLTATQVTKIKAQQSDDDGASDPYTDLAGSGVGPLADGDGNKMLALGIFRPKKRYVRAVVVRGTANAAVDGVLAILFRSGIEPPLPDGTMSAQGVLNTPGAGVA